MSRISGLLNDLRKEIEIESYPFSGGHSAYIAANLKQALEMVPNTGDWHGELLNWCERHLDEKVPPNPFPPGRGDSLLVENEQLRTELEEAKAWARSPENPLWEEGWQAGYKRGNPNPLPKS